MNLNVKITPEVNSGVAVNDTFKIDNHTVIKIDHSSADLHISRLGQPGHSYDLIEGDVIELRVTG